MTTSFRVEPLEGRRLMSTTAVPYTRDDPTPITTGKHGSVMVRGSAYDDSVYATINGATISINIQTVRPTLRGDESLILNGQQVRRTLAFERKAGKNSLSPSSVTLSYPITAVRSITFDGGAGVDDVQLDTATQAITFRRNVEQTRLLVQNPRTHAFRFLKELFVSPIAGQYGGRMKAWLQRSADQIDGAAVAKATAGLVFLGDSIVQRFRTTGSAAYAKAFGAYRPLDLGLTGDTTSQMLYRIQYQGLLDGMEAKTVVLGVGTNNVTLSDNPTATAAGVAAVIQAIRDRLPNADILLSSVLPRPNAFDNRVVNKVNDRLALLADGRSIRFVNATDTFSGARAMAKYYLPGDIHLTANGYTVWAELLQPVVADTFDGG